MPLLRGLPRRRAPHNHKEHGMADYDLVIRNGTVATAADTTQCDIGVRGGTIVALGQGLAAGARDIDAGGKLVLPGAIDSHCHIEQKSSAGVMCADDFYSATVSAAFGGTTTVIPFAAQHRGQSLREVVTEYHAAAEPKAVIDYAFHLIISDPSEQVLGQELPALIRDRYTSYKVYKTYDVLRLDYRHILDIMGLARREGAFMMVHAENHDMIAWLANHPGMALEGAKFRCSPPPRDNAAQEAVSRGLANGTFPVLSSDRAPYRYDETGKLLRGEKTTFKDTANGVPGIELRVALLFSEGVGKGRIDLNRFVALTATNHAKLYGLYPRKGTIAVGSDADIAIWDPRKQVTVRAADIHDNVGYTPYEGMQLTGWPVTVISRGRIVVDDGKLQAPRGSGAFLPCALSDAAKPLGRTTAELAFAAARSGAPLV